MPQLSYNIFSIQANIPHTHEISRLFSRQVVSAECDHPPEVVLLLSSTQAANGKTRNVTLSHFYSKGKRYLKRKLELLSSVSHSQTG